MTSVNVGRDGAVSVIELAHAETRNALAPDTVDLVAAAAAEAAADAGVRLVLLTGASGVFCSGAAIRAWEELDPSGEALADRGTALCDALAVLPIPVLAALPGHAVGGGAELALAADWRIADPAAEIRFVHAGFGLMPGFGGLGRLERLVGPSVALRLLATRAHVGAEEALALGLIDAIVPVDAQRAWAAARAEELVGSDRGAVAEIKRALRDGDERAAFRRVWPRRSLPDRLGAPARLP